MCFSSWTIISGLFARFEQFFPMQFPMFVLQLELSQSELNMITTSNLLIISWIRGKGITSRAISTDQHRWRYASSSSFCRHSLEALNTTPPSFCRFSSCFIYSFSPGWSQTTVLLSVFLVSHTGYLVTCDLHHAIATLHIAMARTLRPYLVSDLSTIDSIADRIYILSPHQR